MHRFSLLLLTILLASCTNQTPVPAPTTPPAPRATATLVATNVPALRPTSARATQVVPLNEPLTAEPTQPEATVLAAPTEQAAAALEPDPITRTLHLETPTMQGDDVKAVQQRLLALGYSELGPADGFFGGQSELAVRSFQQRNTLAVDGMVGVQTWERLFSRSPLAAEGAGPLVPIVDLANGWLLGASRDGRWVAPIDAGRLMAGGEVYTIYVPDGTLATATGTRPTPNPNYDPCRYTHYVTMSPKLTAGVAVGPGWNARPVPVVAGDRQDTQLLNIVVELLKAHGITSPEVLLTQVLAADLDGDGRIERVVAATRKAAGTSPADAAAGDYSLVVVVPEDRVPVVVAEEYHPQAATFNAPSTYELQDLLDLNGDGSLELVLASHYYEGGASAIFTYRERKVELVLNEGCGA